MSPFDLLDPELSLVITVGPGYQGIGLNVERVIGV